MTQPISIAGLAGDGIGHDVFPCAAQMIDTVNELVGKKLFELSPLPYNAEWYLSNGNKPWPEGFEQELMEKFRVMFLIALGDPRVPEGGMAHAKTIILDTGRTLFDTNFNKRPFFVVHPDTVPQIPKGPFDIELFALNNTQVRIREERVGVPGTDSEAVYPEDIHDTVNFRQLLRQAMHRAEERGLTKILVAHKDNVFNHAHGRWADICIEVEAEFNKEKINPASRISIERQLADSFLERLVRSPQTVPGIVVTDRAFGSIFEKPFEVLANGHRGEIPSDLDGVIGRENIEGMYYRRGDSYTEGKETVGVQIGRHSRPAIRENINASIDLAERRGLFSITVIHLKDIHPESYHLWKEVALEEGKRRAMRVEFMHAGDFVATAIASPAQLSHRVFATDNLLGDLCGDAAAGLVGGMGIPPTNCYNTTGSTGKFFLEPLHGSGVNAKGERLKNPNPTATFLTVGELLESFGHPEMYVAVRTALRQVIESGVKTPDLGGTATTKEFSDAVIARFARLVGERELAHSQE